MKFVIYILSLPKCVHDMKRKKLTKFGCILIIFTGSSTMTKFCNMQHFAILLYNINFNIKIQNIVKILKKNTCPVAVNSYFRS